MADIELFVPEQWVDVIGQHSRDQEAALRLLTASVFPAGDIPEERVPVPQEIMARLRRHG